jgi:hypothetical protein
MGSTKIAPSKPNCGNFELQFLADAAGGVADFPEFCR